MNENIYYIKAAILENTGVDVPVEEVKQLLIEEGLLNRHDAEAMIFSGYNNLYPSSSKKTGLGKIKDVYEVISNG